MISHRRRTSKGKTLQTLQTLRALPAPPNRFEPRFEPGGRIRLCFRFHGGESSPHHSLRLPSRLKLHPFSRMTAHRITQQPAYVLHHYD